MTCLYTSRDIPENGLGNLDSEVRRSRDGPLDNGGASKLGGVADGGEPVLGRLVVGYVFFMIAVRKWRGALGIKGRNLSRFTRRVGGSSAIVNEFKFVLKGCWTLASERTMVTGV